jgi:hypothetical protein
MESQLFALGNVSTLIIAIVSVLGLISACLHFQISERIREVSFLGKALVIKQFTPPNSRDDLHLKPIREDNILPQILLRGGTV